MLPSPNPKGKVRGMLAGLKLCRIDSRANRGSGLCFVLALCPIIALGGCSRTRSLTPGATQSASPVSATLLVDADSPQRFTATFRDPKGGSNMSEVTISIMRDKVVPGGRSRWSVNECLVRYDIATNAIWLVPDVGGTWGSHSIAGGSSSSFSNSQCTVMASGSSVEISGDTVTVFLELKFTPQFVGPKQLYLQSADVNGKWSANYQQQFSSFIVAAAEKP
jgi:hypothetical protein